MTENIIVVSYYLRLTASLEVNSISVDINMTEEMKNAEKWKLTCFHFQWVYVGQQASAQLCVPYVFFF